MHEVFRFLNVSASPCGARLRSGEGPVGTSGATDVGGGGVVGSQSLLVDGRGRGALVKVEARVGGVRRTAGTSLGRTGSGGTATDVSVILQGVLVGHGGGGSGVLVVVSVEVRTSGSARLVAIKG